MRQRVDDVFYDQAHRVDRPVKGLKNWGLYGDDALMLEAYQMWEMSGYRVLPFSGGWFDQPWWVRADFKTLMRVQRWHEQNAERPDPGELPVLKD